MSGASDMGGAAPLWRYPLVWLLQRRGWPDPWRIDRWRVDFGALALGALRLRVGGAEHAAHVA